MSPRLILLAFFYSVFLNEVFAQERIEDYQVILDVSKNGSIEVSERIRVFVEGKKIKRGIYRSFPLDNVKSYQPKIPYIDIQVSRDGKEEKIAKRGPSGAYYKVYFGDKDYLLPTSRSYVYEISYNVPKAVLQYPDADVLYWSAIGPEWDFPIEKALISVSLPGDILEEKVFVYSGSKGTSGNMLNVKEEKKSDSAISFSTTRSLEARNGITIEIAMAPETVQDYVRSSGLFQRHPELRVPMSYVITLLLMVLSFLVWGRIGRDPKPITVFPRFKPPKNISPAAARYIYASGNVNSHHVFTTALISAASKGAIKIDGRKIIRQTIELKGLSAGERAVIESLIPASPQPESSWDPSSEIAFFDFEESTEAAKSIYAAKQKLMGYLESEFRFASLQENRGPRLFFLIAFLLTPLWALCFEDFWVLIPIYGLLVLIFWLVLKRSLPKSRLEPLKVRPILLNIAILGLVFLVLPSLVVTFFFGVLFGLFFIFFALVFFLHPFLTTLAMLMVNYTFRNQTKKGREIGAYLSGLKMYIMAAEHRQLSDDEPEPNREQFESIYPYAYALQLSLNWADKYAKEIEAWSKEDAPSSEENLWGQHRSIEKFSSNVKSSSNYREPSSSSSSSSYGGGGGGYSGGGGGGGGGGGW